MYEGQVQSPQNGTGSALSSRTQLPVSVEIDLCVFVMESIDLWNEAKNLTGLFKRLQKGYYIAIDIFYM